MHAPKTSRAAATVRSVRASGGPSSDDPQQNVGTQERPPADGTLMSADLSRLATRLGRVGSEREATVTFRSILLPPGAEGLQKETADEPEFFRDLNLDKIVAAVTAGKDDYSLHPFFYSPIRDLATIEYRHGVMTDLEHNDILQIVRSFAQGMRSARQHLALSAKLHYAHQKKLWFLDAVDTYCAAVKTLAQDLSAANLQSLGLGIFRRYLIDYTNSDGFTALVAETNKLRADLSTIQYSMLIKGDKITVQKYEDSNDYSTVVQSTFSRFKQGAVKDYLVKFTDGLDMNHVEASVLGFVANLYPEIFLYLDNLRGAPRTFRRSDHRQIRQRDTILRVLS